MRCCCPYARRTFLLVTYFFKGIFVAFLLVETFDISRFLWLSAFVGLPRFVATLTQSNPFLTHRLHFGHVLSHFVLSKRHLSQLKGNILLVDGLVPDGFFLYVGCVCRASNSAISSGVRLGASFGKFGYSV